MPERQNITPKSMKFIVKKTYSFFAKCAGDDKIKMEIAILFVSRHGKQWCIERCKKLSV